MGFLHKLTAKRALGSPLELSDFPPLLLCVFFDCTFLDRSRVTILGGAPKVGKSWLVLDLCDRVSKGESIWNLPTHKGTALYLCLEDTLPRVQDRLNSITEDPSGQAFYAVEAAPLAEGLSDQIRQFVSIHRDTILVAIDTFQMIRSGERENSYAADYAEIQRLKELADELSVSILLVHHLRKMDDVDPLNRLSGTTGLSGAADATLILERDNRGEKRAKLTCAGRDIEDRVLTLEFNENHVWELVSDSLEQPALILPEELQALALYIQEVGSFKGGNTELAEKLCEVCGLTVQPKSLKQQMNKWRFTLEKEGVHFRSHRSNGKRLVEIRYLPPMGSDASDAQSRCAKISVPCDPVDPHKWSAAG